MSHFDIKFINIFERKFDALALMSEEKNWYHFTIFYLQWFEVPQYLNY